MSQRSPPRPAWAVSARWLPKIVTTERKVLETAPLSSCAMGGCVTKTIALASVAELAVVPETKINNAARSGCVSFEIPMFIIDDPNSDHRYVGRFGVLLKDSILRD